MTQPVIDPNHDLVPTLRMMDGLLFDKAADEIERWRLAYRKAVQMHADELMVVGPGWHERHKVTATPIVIDGLLQVFTDTPERGALPPQPAEGRTYTQADLVAAVETERYACSLAVWMTLQDALEPDADDKGLDGWMREAEARVKGRR
jgi:hypothetical protein